VQFVLSCLQHDSFLLESVAVEVGWWGGRRRQFHFWCSRRAPSNLQHLWCSACVQRRLSVHWAVFRLLEPPLLQLFSGQELPCHGKFEGFAESRRLIPSAVEVTNSRPVRRVERSLHPV